MSEVNYSVTHTVYSDQGVAFDTPHWRDHDLDGNDTDTAGGDRHSPVTLQSGTVPQIGAVIIVEPEAAAARVTKVNATSPHLSNSSVDGTGALVQAFETVIGVVSFPALPGTVDYHPDGTIDWSVSFDEQATQHAAGTSRNTLFVTWQASREPLPRETYLRLGCRGAKEASSASAIVSGIWLEFEDRDVRRTDGTQLTYWLGGTGDDCTDASCLVSGSNGECGSWAELMIAVAKTQGVTELQKVLIIDEYDVITNIQ